MEKHEMSVIKNTLEGMACDAEDRGEISFRCTLYVKDVYELCKQVTVTRCRNCVHCTDATRNPETVRCGMFSAFMRHDDYCSRGEVKHD